MRLVPVVLFSLVVFGCSGSDPASENTSSDGQTAPAPVMDEMALGEKIYGEYCFSCHTPGLNGAPKLGDAEAWAPRVAKGEALLLQATIEGIPPAMPPRGICMSCSDEELAAAIKFMISGN